MGDFVNIFKIDDNSLNIANYYVRHNMLVAFPTETVYGLGCNALSDDAVKRVYAAKGRPIDNPLIVHLPMDADYSRYVYDNDLSLSLRKAFLPGPLTMVYKSKGVVSPLVSCGLDTLAIRVPSHKGAQRFLKYVDLPIAAPSANVSKHVSPVTAMHVYEDFGDKLPMILDGGRCDGGIESTVLDVTGDVPVILRKGLITAEMIKSVVGACQYAVDGDALNKRSPGTRYRHYCPKVPSTLFGAGEVQKAVEYYGGLKNSGKNPVILCTTEVAENLKGLNVIDLGNTGAVMANRLYAALRESENYDHLIGIRFVVEDEIALGVENRFLKAFG